MRSIRDSLKLGIGVVLLAGLVSGCNQLKQTGSTGNGHARLTGDVSYRERIALPSGAKLQVSLVDQALGDLPAAVVAQQTSEPGKVPAAFSLAYAPTDIQPGHQYLLRAAIRSAKGSVLWSNANGEPVLGATQPREGVKLVLKRVAADPSAVSDAGDVEPAKAGSTLVFECEGLDATVHTRDGEVTLLLPGRDAVLKQVPAASGARYEAPGLMFWDKGATAMIDVDGRHYKDCRNNPARAPWAEAARRGIDYRAIGSKPGWTLEVDEGDHIRLDSDSGEHSVYMPAPKPQFSGGVVRYDVKTGSHDLKVHIKPKPCHDAASGEDFQTQVQVELDGHKLEGCGRYLATNK